MTATDFSSLPLEPALLANLDSLGYQQMTPIQARGLPLVLSGQDLIAQAQTGSGKTVAFGLGLLQRLELRRFRVQSLVLCPTRELADQVAKELRRLARRVHNIKVLTLCGGMPFGPQIGSLQHGAHIIVGTPGRIEEHLRKGTLNLDQLRTLVLDEADRMLAMGFQESLDNIVSHTPRERQTLLFSATYPQEIEAIASRVLKQPARVTIEQAQQQPSIEQLCYQLDDEEQRPEALCQLLLSHRPQAAVVFCNTKRESQQLADQLYERGISARALHGDLEQRQRDQTLVMFANGSIAVLVATDVAARGLDIDQLDLVINYQLSRDPEVHVHRIGRTGRAGRSGLACNLVGPSDQPKHQRIEQYLNQPLSLSPLPQSDNSAAPDKPRMVTLQIDGGKKQKIRPGDIVGALTGPDGVKAEQLGKIQIFPNCAYVAVERKVSQAALNKIRTGKLKGRFFKVRKLR